MLELGTLRYVFSNDIFSHFHIMAIGAKGKLLQKIFHPIFGRASACVQMCKSTVIPTRFFLSLFRIAKNEMSKLVFKTTILSS